MSDVGTLMFHCIPCMRPPRQWLRHCYDILLQVVSDETNGEGVTRILEASGAEHVINGMFSLLRKGGHVTMVGLPKTPIHIENAAHNICRPLYFSYCVV